MGNIEWIVQTWALRGIKSRRKYFAGMAEKYMSEAEEIIDNSSPTEFFRKSCSKLPIIKADYKFAENCEEAAGKELSENYFKRKEKIRGFLKI